MNPRNFFAELKRRNVYKVAVAYAVVGWLVMQVAATVVPALRLPGEITSAVVLLTILGFPIALVLAWAFELTPEGMKRTKNIAPDTKLPSWRTRKFAVLIALSAMAAGALLTFQLLRPRRGTDAAAHQVHLPEKSIAVLPFTNRSRDEENAFFADGVQDEILTRLSKIADLKVISRTSTQKYKNAPENLREVAQQLGVANVLEGSVQKADDQVRITVQLINAVTDAHLWAESYDRKLVDIFAVQSDVAQKVASALEARLTGREKRAIEQVGTTNTEAYNAYLEARTLRHSQSPKADAQLIELCRRAVELDPNYVQAWALLGLAEANRYFIDERTDAQLARAKDAAEKAMKLDPDLGEARLAMASVLYYGLQDFEGALQQLEEARQRLPNDGEVLMWMGLVRRRQGRLDEAIELQHRAAVLDPLNPSIWVNLGRSYRGKRKLGQAREFFDRALAIVPADRANITQKAETYIAEGDLEAAGRLLEAVPYPFASRGYGHQITLMVYRRQFEEAFAKVSDDLEKNKSLPPLATALVHAVLGHLQAHAGNMEAARPFLLQAQREFETLREQGEKGTNLHDWLIHVYGRLGDRAKVEKEAERLLALTAKDAWDHPDSERAVAVAYAALGDADRAIPLLESALVAAGAESLTTAYLRLDPLWDPIRHDPRFQKLLAEKPKL